MPHLSRQPDSRDCRIDVVCFARDIHPEHALYPLVLAECKAGAISPEAVEQALGYNAQIGAAFVLLVNPQELRLYSPRAGDKQLRFAPHLLHYQELVQQAKCMYG